MAHISKFAKDTSVYTNLLSHIVSYEESATEMKNLDSKGAEVPEESESLGYESDEWSLVSEGKDEEGVMSGSEDEEAGDDERSNQNDAALEHKKSKAENTFEVQKLQASGHKTAEAEPATEMRIPDAFDFLSCHTRPGFDDVKIFIGKPFSPHTQAPDFDRNCDSEERIAKALDHRLKIFFEEDDRGSVRCTFPYCDRLFPAKDEWREHFELRHRIEFERVRDAVRANSNSPPRFGMGSGSLASPGHMGGSINPPCMSVKHPYGHKNKPWDPISTIGNMKAPQPVRPQMQREDETQLLPAMGCVKKNGAPAPCGELPIPAEQRSLSAKITKTDEKSSKSEYSIFHETPSSATSVVNCEIPSKPSKFAGPLLTFDNLSRHVYTAGQDAAKGSGKIQSSTLLNKFRDLNGKFLPGPDDNDGQFCEKIPRSIGNPPPNPTPSRKPLPPKTFDEIFAGVETMSSSIQIPRTSEGKGGEVTAKEMRYVKSKEEAMKFRRMRREGNRIDNF